MTLTREGDSFHPETEEGQKFRVLYHKVKAFRYVLITFKWENGDLEAHADGGESPQQVFLIILVVMLNKDRLLIEQLQFSKR